MVDRLHVYIDGYVQGVGFRFSARERAESLGLSGWVRNLPDGRVECECEGAKPDLDAMLEWCRQGPRMAEIAQVEEAWQVGPARYQGFRIVGW